MNEENSLQYERLRRKRAHRRGQVTRIQHAINEVAEKRYSDIRLSELNRLKKTLEREIEAHEALHDQMEDLAAVDDDLLRVEQTERDKHEAIHSELIETLGDLFTKTELWGAGMDLLSDLEALQALKEPSKPHFIKAFAEFRKGVKDFSHQSHGYSDDEAIPSIIKTLREAITNLNLELEKALSKEPTPSVAPTTTTESISRPKAAPINVQLPKFDGDPLQWRHFSNLFTTAIRTRAGGFSELDKRCLLVESLISPEAKMEVTNAPEEASLDELMELLCQRFGRPQTIVPILIKQVSKPDFFTSDYAGLQRLVQQFFKGADALKHYVGDSLSSYLMYSATMMFTPKLKAEWDQHVVHNGIKPSMDELRKYISARLLQTSASDPPMSVSTAPPQVARPTYTIPQPSKSPRPKPAFKCSICEERHSLLRCPTFIGYDVDKRNKVIREKRLCINCLAEGHGCKSCPSKFTCKTCHLKHHSLLHKDKPDETSVDSRSIAASTTDVDSSIPQAKPSFPNTIVVSLHHGGRKARARAVLDSGAGVSMMSESLASTLKLPRNPQRMSLGGSFSEGHSKFCVSTQLYSEDMSFVSKPIVFSVVPKMKPIKSPSHKDHILKLPSLKSLPLADPELGGPIDLYIGNMDLDSCIYEGSLKFDGLKIINTPFGWSIAGPLSSDEEPLAFMTTAAPDDLQEDLAKLWQLDQVPEAPNLSPEADEVIRDFEKTHSRIEGRFAVVLPRPKQPPPLGDSRPQAFKRLISNEKSLKTKGKLDAFNKELREYVSLGHAEVIPWNELRLKPHYYLPVHGVFKETSTTTKIRPVFDASAKTTSGFSLNDTLLTGPNLYPPLPDVIIRFRRFKIGMSADISKMFREVMLDSSERNLHRFILRQEDGSLADCRMLRLTFGVKPSPYLATQVLRTLAKSAESSHPKAAQAILKDFYVDDYLSGADSVDSAHALRVQLCGLLQEAGMSLRKWRSNSTDLLKQIPEDLREACPLSLQAPNQAPKALGVHWDVQTDTLHVSTPVRLPHQEPITKRIIASGTASVFDVLGLFAPAVIIARILLQDLWQLSLSWDEVVPQEHQDRWNLWLDNLPSITNFSIPRRFSDVDNPVIYQALHGFSDASSVAYGAVVYLRRVHSDNLTTVTLVVAKARVLPLKPVTIPKAELLAAHLLTKLIVKTADVLDISTSGLYAWSDSEIVLHWLAKDPLTLERFVANRVHAISTLLPHSHWRHVSTHDNPADLASRGLHAKDLILSQLWWKGPPWLKLSPQQWPSSKFAKNNTVKLEVPCLLIQPKLTAENNVRKAFAVDLWNRCSSFHKLTRVLAWIFRFCNNARRGSTDKSNSKTISSTEVLKMKSVLFRLSQRESFPEVFSAIKDKKQIPKGHPLRRYLLQLADTGHLLVSSRVRDSKDTSQPKLLIPLSSKCPFTKLLVSTLHRTYSHAGPTALTSILGSSYVIPGLHNLLKKISRTCPQCQRAYAKPLSCQMGLLPASRTTPAPPFDKTGVDFAGPLLIKQGYTRKPVLLKTYVSVFVCLATKAIHLELCASLSTEDFLATFKRFVARRGCPSAMFSDNGTNFVGAREEIRELQRLIESREVRDGITSFASSHGIEWHHIPPRAPHFGGLWEAAVKSMKTLLRKNIKPHPLRFDELYTLLTEIEAVLNSRPLVPLKSGDIEEEGFLTAGHFLVGRPLRAAPTSQPPSGKISSLRRWNLVSRLTAEFWEQWLQTYLASCAQRAKWTRPTRSLSVGEVVFLKDETLRVREWPLAVITKIFPGTDGQVRTVQLRCRGQTYTRAANRTIPFVSDDGQHSTDAPSTPAPREDVWDSRPTAEL